MTSDTKRLYCACKQLFKEVGIFLTLLAISLNGYSQQAKTSQKLNEGWQFLKGDLGGIWEAVRPARPGRPESVPLWKPVSLPHSYNAEDAVDPDNNYYQGPAWYRKTVEIDNPYKNGRVLLHFEGAGQKTQVYVYTQKAGEHVGGYDEWTVDITDAVKKFRNHPDYKRFGRAVPVSIRTDNSRDLQMIPSDMADHIIYGGLYRGVELKYVPGLSLETILIDPQTDAGGRQGQVTLRASLYNPVKLGKTKLELEISSPSGQIVETLSRETFAWEGMREIFSFSVEEPELWSPESPSLYEATIKLTTSSGTQLLKEKFGFRHFRFAEQGPFYLNGKRLLLKGTHRHEDFAGVGAAETENMIRKEMILMKEMGVNFVRLGHYQQREFVLDMADSLGFLIWEEIPWNRGGLGGEAYKQQARRMLRNMITQHYNHPSIILWGLGNENDWPGDFPEFDKKKIRDFMTELNDLAHRLDKNRKTSIRRCDFCKDIVDVYSPSIWAGWYSGRYTEYRDASREQMEQVDHFFHAEWGGDSHARRHAEDPYKYLGGIEVGQGVAEEEGDAALTGGDARASSDGDWSESYIVDLFDWHLKEQEKMPWLTGTAQWIFKDFATPLRPNNPVPYVNSKGVVTRDLKKKEGYYVFQSYWTEEPMAHIYGHTWPVRWGEEGEEKMIKVYSNCPEAELFVNGESMGIRQRDSQDFPAAGLRWRVPLYKGDDQVKVVACKGQDAVTDSLSFRYQTEKWGEPAKLQLEKVAEQNDTTTVQVKLLDIHGVLCLDARNVVRFGLTGDGELLDNLGTSDGSRKVEVYNGRAIIRIKNNGGKSVVSVQSEGMPTSFVTVGVNDE